MVHIETPADMTIEELLERKFNLERFIVVENEGKLRVDLERQLKEVLEEIEKRDAL